jgi:hypothetical protein
MKEIDLLDEKVSFEDELVEIGPPSREAARLSECRRMPGA